ncbi:hypothetical protein FAM09_08850 [Niastella caeni]|uniref:DUF4397 domain-containing protein n=1 Tax=Niastella caeni TaxID=2569763 RepID=A0A4S8HYT2_9BACT|nr:hypothetical protein [Niastella caeni]THU39989.1 hypothetical protein FAM09_08850 [Niastella caeni]
MIKTILSIPLVLLLFTACRKTSNPTVFDLGVDMQASFNKDHVQVLIDNQPLLNSEVTTINLLGIAKSISTAATEGNHSIKVIVNDSIVKTENFTQSGNLYIGVNYNKATNTVSIAYSARPYTYI